MWRLIASNLLYYGHVYKSLKGKCFFQWVFFPVYFRKVKANQRNKRFMCHLAGLINTFCNMSTLWKRLTHVWLLALRSVISGPKTLAHCLKSDIQHSRSLVPVCAIVHIQKPMFFSSFSPFKLHFPKSYFGDELAPTVALQSGLIFYNMLENERENDMEINHILLLDQNHSLSLSCSLPWVNYSLHTAIDLSSNRKFSEYLCKDCNWQNVSFNRKMPTFPHKLIINSIEDPTATATEKG